MIQRVLNRVPAYSAFLTVDELSESSRRLAAAHPDIVRTVRIGASTDGEPIEMLRIGTGSEQLLFFACPHPNEPIGAMTLEALSAQLAVDEDLRGTKYTWNLIKCIDPDSTRLNEGWFKGPFTITHYASEFYRPASFDQAEWSFPVVYKGYSFFRPIPETVALMTAISGLRPRFIYSLHNAGMGGGYYYLSPHKPEIDGALRTLMTDRGVPLSLGEPEMPWGVQLSPAIYRSTSLVDHYDFLERFGEADPASPILPFSTPARCTRRADRVRPPGATVRRRQRPPGAVGVRSAYCDWSSVRSVGAPSSSSSAAVQPAFWVSATTV